jgi:GNAT superfamily N-acetyltransferase
MIAFYLIISFIFLGFVYLGYRRTLRLDHLNRTRVLNALLAAVIIITILSLGHWFGFFSQSLATKIIMGAYSLATGFFLGYGSRLIILRRKNGDLEYMYRSFWTDIAPNLIFIALFAFGLFRTGLFRFTYFSGIEITSGCSLLAFSFLGWTVRIVPEFRGKGILLLDQFIEWKKVVAYRWIGEETLQIDYYTDSEEISEFKTYIPSEDELFIERLLGKKLNQYKEERRDLFLQAEGT